MLSADELTGWIIENGGPILRYRTRRDLQDDIPQSERDRLREACLAAPEVRRWLENLAASRSIHGRQDTNAENPLAKLLEYGLDRSVPAFDAQVQRLLDEPLKIWEDLVLFPFLIRAGYAEHPRVQTWLMDRIERLDRIARSGDFDFYLPVQEALGVPKAWRGKPIYRDDFGHAAGYALPTCYDLLALGYCPPIPGTPDLSKKLERIAAFACDPRFQTTVGGYGWDRPRHRCYAAGRVFLACVEPCRQVLFLEWAAPFASARRSDWFQHGLAALEACRTTRGTYRFPPEWIAERTGYYIYSGSHMGLGEDRRSPLGLELESTFRMLNIKKRAVIKSNKSI